ncbi:hypothetical protein CRE_23044 [Caenorhabditis remanei]|uniref:T-box domain-containing protein n=1 Tax=Caenorhabditis remanei TaxID=31234 RepID=E3N4I0_CAERE|nr:hypothetical protein CRE_23044 [Caenorhabditis remanei]
MSSAIKSSIAVSMVDDVFWRQCYNLTNEIKLQYTRGLVSPSLSYKVSGLDPKKNYSMTVRFEQPDDKKWKWIKNQYQPCERPDNIECVSRTINHWKGQQKGSWWMKNNVDFNYIQLTSRTYQEDYPDMVSFSYLFQIRLQRCFKYIPVLNIFENEQLIHAARLEHTEFIAVHTINNRQLKDLKRHIRSLRRVGRCYVSNFNLNRFLQAPVPQSPLAIINKPKDFSIRNILANK